jgi:hypothetical protein
MASSMNNLAAANMKQIALLMLALAGTNPAFAAEKSVDEIAAEVLRAESALYRAVFDDCDADQLSAIVAPELEFFHDKGGQVARSGPEFVSAIRGSCLNQRAGKETKTRRELIPGSMVVHRMGNYGALAVGMHRFFHLPPGAAEIPTEQARFANLWRFDKESWLLARVFSFEHQPFQPSLRAK